MRWTVACAASVVVLVSIIGLAGLPLYVFPREDEVTSADLIYVIGPPTKPRTQLGRELIDDGVADRMLISVAAEGENSAEAIGECQQSDVLCATPTPFTTMGEVRMLTELAPDVSDVVVVTFTPHVARTRFLFEKCFSGTATVVAVDANLGFGQWIYEYAYQTAAFVKAWFEPCEP